MVYTVGNISCKVRGCEAGQGCRHNTSPHVCTLCSWARKPHSAQRAVLHVRLTVLDNKYQHSVKVDYTELQACWRQREGHPPWLLRRRS